VRGEVLLSTRMRWDGKRKNVGLPALRGAGYPITRSDAAHSAHSCTVDRWEEGKKHLGINPHARLRLEA